MKDGVQIAVKVDISIDEKKRKGLFVACRKVCQPKQHESCFPENRKRRNGVVL